MKFISNSENETFDLGQKIGRNLKGGECLLLKGDLGGGKTRFTKGLAAGLGIKDTVISPTFTIERSYNNTNGPELHHFDFYRLLGGDSELSSEVAELIGDKNAVVVSEWPENLGYDFGECIVLEFEYVDDSTRAIEINPAKYKYILEELS